jgi:hypothetical protein
MKWLIRDNKSSHQRIAKQNKCIADKFEFTF